MWCAALIMRNPRGFMRLFICLLRWKQVCCCCCSVSVLTLGWTHGTNAVVQRSLALIPALVKRHSCFSSHAALLVNLQEKQPLIADADVETNSLAEFSTAAYWCGVNHQWPTWHLSAAAAACALLSFLFLFPPPAMNQWKCAHRDQGQLLPTSWLLSSSKVPI